MDYIKVEKLPALIRLMKKQNGPCWVRNGPPVKIFVCDGFLCAAYQNGAWFHYDLNDGTWF